MLGVILAVLVEAVSILVRSSRLAPDVVDEVEGVVVCADSEAVGDDAVLSVLTVPGVVEVSEDVDVDLAVVAVDEVVELPSSGQTPVVQGSLEQHPRKSPAEQTYHCLPLVHVLRVRGDKNFIVERKCRRRMVPTS